MRTCQDGLRGSEKEVGQVHVVIKQLQSTDRRGGGEGE